MATYNLFCAPGIFTLTGQDVRADYRLQCDAGVFALGGQDASLNLTPWLDNSVESPSYGVVAAAGGSWAEVTPAAGVWTDAD